MVSAAGATLLLRGLEPTFVPAIAGSGFWLLLTGILALRRKEVPSPAWKIAVLGVVLVDLFVAGYDLNPTRRLEEKGNDRGVLEQISEAHRIYYPSQVEQKVKFDIAFRFDTFEPKIPWESIRETGLPNISMLENIPAADNFDPILTDRYSFFIDQLEGAPVETQRAVYPWLNVGWIADLPAAPHPDHPVAFLPVEAPVQVWFVDGVERVDDYDRAIRRALNGVEWGSLAILEADSLGPNRMQTAPSGSAHIVERDITGDTVVAVQLQRGGWLVLADSYYPGWTVKVDGEKRQVYPANGILRAVWVEPGEQRVEFSYQPFSFRAGVVTSLLALLLILVGWIQCRR